MTDTFHEEVAVELILGAANEPGEVNRALRGLGFRLDYDVYSLPRPDLGSHPEWQSECVVEVELLRADKEVEAQMSCDTLRLVYPLATLDSSMVGLFTDAVRGVQASLGGDLRLGGDTTTIENLDKHLTDCVSDLMESWGEEPGSENLCIMIEDSHGSA